MRLHTPAMPTFGENLQRVRESRGWSQETLGRKLGHKRPGTVQSWEKARRAPRLKSVERLAVALGCEPAELLQGASVAYAQPANEMEHRALTALRGMPSLKRRTAAVVFLERAQRGEQSHAPHRESAAPVTRTPPATGRKARGTR